ncbi:MAG: phosphoserine phosphatase RsbU/P [Actinomycetota bacterium]|nr:phosphoserine phosphatase RsbU/P [Actinomycetota bacterium]
MISEAFCGTCMRTVYRGSSDGDACPVCSSPLLETASDVTVTPSSVTPSALIPDNEDLRMAAVGRYEILDTPPDGAFDRITNLAARIFEVPIATITVVDEDRIWFKSKHGIDAEQIGRDPGLCASAIIEYEPWVVNDALSDPRTLENPLVRGDLGLRFYAGAPLTTADGYNLGTLNIIDKEPRELTDDQLMTLKQLADIVVDELELRLAALRLFRAAEDKGVALGA